MLLPLLIFFFYWRPFFLFFWFCVRKINITFEVWQFFCTGKLIVAFLKNWTTTEKGCPFHFESYDKGKLLGFPETSFNSPHSQIFEFFVIEPKVWWCASVCLSYPYRLVLFLYVLLFAILRIFSILFFCANIL